MKSFLIMFFSFGWSFAFQSNAQSPLKSLKILKEKKAPWLNDILQGKSPVTTELNDATYEVPVLDTFAPTYILHASELPRDAEGNFLLFPGVWEMQIESYCLKVGTNRPSQGEGHIYAPLQGSKAELIISILRNSQKHLEIEQNDIQVLLWAIIARTPVKDIPKEYLVIASKLLSADELLTLNGGVIEILSPEAEKRAYANVPKELRSLLEAENHLRSKLAKADASYQELEKIAVLDGVTSEKLGRTVVKGRWSLHPDNFYIQYLPSSYNRTVIRIYLPEEKYLSVQQHAVRRSSGTASLVPSYLTIARGLINFDPSDGVAVPPGNGQRLGQSGRRPNRAITAGGIPDKIGRSDSDNPIDKARKITGAMETAKNAFELADGGPGALVGIKNPFSPDNLAMDLVNWILDNGQKISDALSMDPPNEDFKTYAQLKKYEYNPPSSVTGKSTANINVTNAFVTSLLGTYAKLKVAAESIDKHGGAVLAKDKYWIEQQAKAIIYYKKAAGISLMETCNHWDAFIKMLKQSGFTTLVLSKEKLIKYQENLRKNGFNNDQLKAYRILDLSDKEIDFYKYAILQVNPQEFSGDILENWLAAISAFRELGTMYTHFPTIKAPWED